MSRQLSIEHAAAHTGVSAWILDLAIRNGGLAHTRDCHGVYTTARAVRVWLKSSTEGGC